MPEALQDLRADIRVQHAVTWGTEVNRRTSLQSITNEYHVISRTSPYYVRLEEVPDNVAGVTIPGYTASSSMPVSSTQFYVDYSIGYVYFYSSEAGKQAAVSYFGKGSAVDAVDINAHTAAVQKGQIITERLRPYAQETPDQSIGIKPGVYFVGKAWRNYLGNTAVRMGTNGEYQVSAMTANFYNKILFTLTDTGLLRKYEATPAGNPITIQPSPTPAGELPICVVTVRDNGTGGAGTINNIGDSAILDIRATVVTTSAQMDTHIISTANPHSVTQTQVGLPNVTNDSQLKRAAGDLNSFTLKATPVNADVLVIEDSADVFNKKKVTVGSLPAGGGGADVKTAVFEGGVQVGTAGRRLDFNGNDFNIAEDVVNDQFDVTVNRNAANGVAGLDASALLPAAQLPTHGSTKHDSTVEATANKGIANGYASLDASILIPLAQIPATLTGKDADTVDTKHFTDIQADSQGKVDTHNGLAAPHGAATSVGGKGLPAGVIVGTTDTQELQGKTLNNSKIKDVDVTPVGDVILKTLDGVPQFRNAADTADASLALGSIPATLTGKDADTVDTFHGAALEKTANKGVASGYCDLDASILVPLARIPATLTGKDADSVDGIQGTSIVRNDQNNVLGAFYEDIAQIVVPANPAAGTRRVFVDAADGKLKVRTSAGTSVSLEEGAGGGEANTASNVGTAGVGVFKQKVGVNLEFKKVNPGSTKVTITDDAANSEVDVDVAEANIVHQNLSGAGTNTHAAIDTHIAAAVAHGATGAVVGTTNTQELANKTLNNQKIKDVDATPIGDVLLKVIDGVPQFRNNADTADAPIALGSIPATLTGKDADTVDTFHAAALEKTINKGAANGYAGLDAGIKVPTVQLGGVGADNTKFLRGDQTWAVPGGGGDTTVKLTADVATTVTTFADATGLSFSAAANTDYIFEFIILYTTSVNSTGINLAVNGPASPTALALMWQSLVTAGTGSISGVNSYDTGTAMVSSRPGNNLATMRGLFRNGANAGTFILRFATEIDTSTVTIKIGSVLKYRQV